MHLAKDVLNKAKYDITIQTTETPQCTFYTLRYFEIRHVCLIYYPLTRSISMPTILKIDKSHNFLNVLSCYTC